MIISMPNSFFVPIVYVDERKLVVDINISDDFRNEDKRNIYRCIDDEYADNAIKKNIY